MEHNKGSHGREKSYTTTDKKIYKRGNGLGLGGPVGNASGYSDRNRRKGSGTVTKAGGGLTLLLIVLSLLFGNSGTNSTAPNSSANNSSNYTKPPVISNQQISTSINGWLMDPDMGQLDMTVRSGSRAKRTQIIGNGQDKVTIMVYMCGTDLESKSGMATADILEMVNAKISDNVDLLIYTGGCRKWQNQVVKADYNQIYQVKEGGVANIKNYPASPMVDPSNLTEFIRFCNENYPANRRELILWDHGGGSVTGYGNDEKYQRSGSMTLSGIDTALKNANTSFDFIGFDACLMATIENGLMLDKYADYLIASEELEPGNGWYYTDWISTLSANTSISTLELGKKIIDDYASFYKRMPQGTSTTLSLTDLAELSAYGPKAMNAFASETSKLIKNDQYKLVSNARSRTREFSASSKIDQIDLAHLALNTNTASGKELFEVIASAVKYNRVSADMTNSYGLSAYFPYRRIAYVDPMVKTYHAIGIDDEYAKCIQTFAGVETTGQAASGGTSDPLGALLNGYSGSSSATSEEMIYDLLSLILNGGYNRIKGLDRSNTAFMSEGDTDYFAKYVSDNQFIPGDLFFQNVDGHKILRLSDEQWDLIDELTLNVFYDDGEGYIDLGMDNTYEFIDDGDLLAEYDGTWLAINGQPVAYYFLDEVSDGNIYTIKGRSPAYLNGERVDLIIEFSNEDPNGSLKAVRYVYENDETMTAAKELDTIKDGDVLDFICDYYSYDGDFIDNYYLGDQMVIDGQIVISNVSISDAEVRATYRLKDIYNQTYWTPNFY